MCSEFWNGWSWVAAVFSGDWEWFLGWIWEWNGWSVMLEVWVVLGDEFRVILLVGKGLGLDGMEEEEDGQIFSGRGGILVRYEL